MLARNILFRLETYNYGLKNYANARVDCVSFTSANTGTQPLGRTTMRCCLVLEIVLEDPYGNSEKVSSVYVPPARSSGKRGHTDIAPSVTSLSAAQCISQGMS